MDWKKDDFLRGRLLKLITDAYKQSEVLVIISKEFPDYYWSLGALQRKLRYFGIKRNDPSLTAFDVLSHVKDELEGTGKPLGYRSMFQKIRSVHGLRVQQQHVYQAMQLLDPDGLKGRSLGKNRKKFVRRKFTSKGPNWVWSFDGHDKLMGFQKNEFPLAIHGCIDTFSRKIIWLKAWPSNSSPKLPAKFYYEALAEHKVLPCKLRADKGNETNTLFAAHNFMRDTGDGSSFLYGSSITNIVIESWWSKLRERNGVNIRSRLDQIYATGLYNSGDETCRVILAVIMIPFLQNELDHFKTWWNTHRIRTQKKINRPCGIPDFMFHHPDAYGYKCAGYQVDQQRLSYIGQEFGLATAGSYVMPGVQNLVNSILKDANLLPITLANFIEAYTLIASGIRQEGITLEFEKP